uniref:Inward rectifier potassium channel Kirbac3.1 n=1 Tax=Paramagnetospirillum magnetotacticum TaxID=188 RepID=UPI001E281C54|nr:Chain A, Inward rectifier potassium channel Kirbac3.1 [Paramagnetospirillum magnetotacticum]
MTGGMKPPARKPRILNSDGSSNITRLGLEKRGWLDDHYHDLLTVSWPVFITLITGLYLVTNALFALAYLASGDVIENARPGSFTDAFFFSVQTMATIGYGKLIPIGPLANTLVTLEALCGMLGMAVAASLIYARFTRPTAGVLFSSRMVISDFEGKPTLMMRLANLRIEQIIEADVHLVLVRSEISQEGMVFRRFHDLTLTRSRSPIFSLSWTVMHPIDHHSPIYGETDETLRNSHSEFLVLFTGHHEAFAQNVHARHAYSSDEIIWGGHFVDVFTTLPDGRRALDLGKFHEIAQHHHHHH